MQVSYQLKILTTAIFSVVMLNKSLNKLQWLSLFMLFLGVSVVQLQPVDGSSKTPNQTQVAKQSPLLGFAAVIMSSICSGFAGMV